MFLRVSKVKQKAGVAEYLQLCINERDPVSGKPTLKVIYHFGRKDQLDMEALRRLVTSISRFFPPSDAAQMVDRIRVSEATGVEFLGSRQLGGCWLLDGLWQRLGIARVLAKSLPSKGFTTPHERLIFAMVANRALAPSSKLAIERWVADEVVVPGLATVDVHQLYRAMDWLLATGETLQREVFFGVANALDLDIDVIYFDTTTTYFEVPDPDPDEPDPDGQAAPGLRQRGYSKDNHAELAQVVIAFACTRTGIPVRCWVWPGHTGDQAVIDEVKRDLQGWNLARVLFVADTGFNSDQNRRRLQQAGGHYILGEKLRLGPKGAPVDVLSHPGRFRTLANGLQIKEVFDGGDSTVRRRFVIVINPDEAKRDKAKRDDILDEVQRQLTALKALDGEPHEKAACKLRAHPVFGRYVTQTPTGRLVLHRDKIAAEEHLDGKFLISGSDDRLSAEDLVLGYKQLWHIERLFRDLKHTVDIRPVYHRLPERIRAHVLLCWLALLLIRVAENETKQTWRDLAHDLDRLHLGHFRTDDADVWQTSTLAEGHQQVFADLQIKPPPRFYELSSPPKTRA